jgi:non-ribosomal peptide synthetase component E (peptide arylation enzyme)
MAPEADEFKIVDETRTEEVPDGQPGELAARGAGVFRGYFRNPEENADNFDDDGWFYTEDVLERDEEGNFRVHGRLKDTIIRGGENIFAPGVEDEIIEHPAVENVAVIGMPDERLGERPIAYVTLTQGSTLSLDALTAYLEERGLAVFKHPERLEVVDELPRTEVDKIDKVALKERITGELRGEGTLSGDY